MPRLLRYILIFFPTMLVSTFLKTWVLRMLWGWFLVPRFNITVPGFAQTYGLILMFGLVSGAIVAEAKRELNNPKKEVKFDELTPEAASKMEAVAAGAADSLQYTITSAIANPFATLALGWFVHLFT